MEQFKKKKKYRFLLPVLVARKVKAPAVPRLKLMILSILVLWQPSSTFLARGYRWPGKWRKVDLHRRFTDLE
ncbi:hypothetical protein [Escherichia coli]|uniref:hypothetical protein n=1 Tax=Escherichia coli TaxID=562 RepID=UPI004068B75B